ncbi:MAG: nucleotidyl transferase AbiEii/AbiGii toxin family protein [Bacteriovoracia bacterium]
MSEIYLLPSEERQLFFDTAVVESGISLAILEKDFWVVWTLERLFELAELQEHLTFKGGTSLSKVYGLIHRFSEDIDLSIEKEFFGFDGESDPEKAASKKKQKAAIDSLGKLCSEYVQGKMLASLRQGIAAKLGATEGWSLTVDTKDPDGQTLLFDYPTLTAKGGYIEPSVKIEMGARSEHWPVSEHKIHSYLKDTLKEKVTEEKVTVRVLNAERTFWEKATILHQYAHFPEGKAAPRRISRHFYDFCCLLGSDIKAKALNDISLLERVATHKSVYFPSGWANYGTARKGSLKLSPPDKILTALENDYELMASMFFRERPDWTLILKTIGEFEVIFNSGEK